RRCRDIAAGARATAIHFSRKRIARPIFFFSSRRRHTRFSRDWSSDVCSSDLHAPHLLQEIALKNKGHKITTTIDYHLQLQVNNLVKRHHGHLKQNGVHNTAVMVMDISTREVLAYIGNSPTSSAHQKDVDIIKAPRSTGSLLKPFLYAAMLDNGTLLPEALVADVPTQIAGYRPENYSQQYAGAVSARRA